MFRCHRRRGDVERGRKEPSIATVKRIARALEVTVRELVEVVDEPIGERSVSKYVALAYLREQMPERLTSRQAEAIDQAARIGGPEIPL